MIVRGDVSIEFLELSQEYELIVGSQKVKFSVKQWERLVVAIGELVVSQALALGIIPEMEIPDGSKSIVESGNKSDSELVTKTDTTAISIPEK